MYPLADRIKLALYLLSKAGRNFDPYSLAGKEKRLHRQKIMSALLGKNVPLAQCGVTNIRDEFYKLSGVQDLDECLAVKQDHFVRWARERGA